MKYKFNNWNTTGRATDLAVFTTRFEGELHELLRKTSQNHFTWESFLKMLYYL